MKKVFFKTMVVAALAGTSMSSCVEVEDLYDPEYAAKVAEYRAQWVKQFGEIDPNEDWGFASEESSEVKSEVMTRGVLKKDQFGLYNVSAVKDITSSEISSVLAVFNQKMDEVVGESVNWSDYYVQHVYASRVEYKDNYGNPVVGSDKMNHLVAGSQNNEVNDFNKAEGSVVLMQNVDTKSFGYHNSCDSKEHFEYIIKCINGEYYVGFDFYADGSLLNQQVERDYIYNDWIVKIVPAEYTKAKRIICEDLGEIGDFDFNDVVFDAYIDGGTAVITVRAAGGTLPVTIGGVDVHKAFGVADDVMVNTGAAGGKSCPPAIFRIPVSSDNLCDIEVAVQTGGNAVCVLKAPKGDAPQKICVTTDFVWPEERVNIKDNYPNFPGANWAGAATDEEVEEEVVVPEGSIDITQYAGDQGNLYEAQRIPAELFGTNGAVITIETTGKVGSLYACYSSGWTSVASMDNNSSIVDAGTYTFEITAEECAGIKKAGWLYITFNGNSNVVTKMTLTNN